MYNTREFIKVNFTCKGAVESEHERMENSEPLYLDYIDEIYFAPPLCVRNFLPFYAEIPERIVVTVADEATLAEYRALFDGDAASLTH